MNIIKFPSDHTVDAAMQQDEPMLALIAFDGKTAIIGQLDEAVEHHVLLSKMGCQSTDIDKYFRIVFDRSGADWTFVCPPDYKGIPFKDRRIEAFYKDGFARISDFLHSIGYLIGINIPKRYRRHLDAMQSDSTII